MSFWSNPFKAFKGFVNNFIPFGRHLTGADVKHQKFHYEEAANRYRDYAKEADSNINNLTTILRKSMEQLEELGQRKQAGQLKAQEMQNQVGLYHDALEKSSQRQAGAMAEFENLKSAIEGFKGKLPSLESKIGEAQKTPRDFLNLFDSLTKTKEKLKGLNEEEAGKEISQYKEDVEKLKQRRQLTEDKMRSSLAEVASQHQNLASEKANLEERLKGYLQSQNQLQQENTALEQRKNQLQNLISSYSKEQEELKNQYLSKEAEAKGQEKQLQDYINISQQHLNNLGGEIEFRAGKYKKAAGHSALAQTIGLAALTWGAGAGIGSLTGKLGIAAKAGSTVGSALKTLAPLVGAGYYLNKAGAAGHKLKAVDAVDLGRSYNGPDLANIAKFGLGSPKQNIPELGGLKQALSHFNLPSVPKLQDLPELHESLGKIVSPQDIEGLTLGLPSLTSASGKKYSTEVLYNPDFIKKLRRVSYGLAIPYTIPHFKRYI